MDTSHIVVVMYCLLHTYPRTEEEISHPNRSLAPCHAAATLTGLVILCRMNAASGCGAEVISRDPAVIALSAAAQYYTYNTCNDILHARY